MERHILKKPFFLDLIDKVLNPILGKSIAFYFVKNMKWNESRKAFKAMQKIGLFIIKKKMAELHGMKKVNVIHGIIVSV